MNGWQEFEAWIREIRERMEDRWAPVALVCLQAEEDGDAVKVFPDKDATILWPAALDTTERGPLLSSLARRYAANDVLRWPT